MADERFWADVKVGGEHLRLFSEHNGHGALVSVYNVSARHWIAPFEPVDNIEHGKEKAAAYAEAYLYPQAEGLGNGWAGCAPVARSAEEILARLSKTLYREDGRTRWSARESGTAVLGIASPRSG